MNQRMVSRRLMSLYPVEATRTAQRKVGNTLDSSRTRRITRFLTIAGVHSGDMGTQAGWNDDTDANFIKMQKTKFK